MVPASVPLLVPWRKYDRRLRTPGAGAPFASLLWTLMMIMLSALALTSMGASFVTGLASLTKGSPFL